CPRCPQPTICAQRHYCRSNLVNTAKMNTVTMRSISGLAADGMCTLGRSAYKSRFEKWTLTRTRNLNPDFVSPEACYNGAAKTPTRGEFMSSPKERRFAHTDIDLLRVRMKLTPGHRLQAMLDAHAVMVGITRGRLRLRYPELSDR